MIRTKNAVSAGGFLVVFAWLASICALMAEPQKPETPKTGEKSEVTLSKNREQLDLPGIKIRLKERYVDVDAKVALSEGLLELIACAKDTKEHESIIAVQAKAAHIHAALLLIGAKAGNPAMRKPVEGEEGRWVDLPPRGSKIDVFLVIEGEDGKPVERPINEFIMKTRDQFGTQPDDGKEKPKEQFHTNTFLFAGSHIYKPDEGPPKYLADVDGNVISISTFGDEMLCLPGFYGHGNEGLVWEVDPTHMPAIGADVILRLRPQFPDAKPAEKKD